MSPKVLLRSQQIGLKAAKKTAQGAKKNAQAQKATACKSKAEKGLSETVTAQDMPQAQDGPEPSANKKVTATDNELPDAGIRHQQKSQGRKNKRKSKTARGNTSPAKQRCTKRQKKARRVRRAWQPSPKKASQELPRTPNKPKRAATALAAKETEDQPKARRENLFA